MEDGFEWEPDNENVLDAANWPRAHGSYPHFFECFGFHPYKEIILFYDGYGIVAYLLNSSKFRYLGTVNRSNIEVRVSFAYAACWMRDLPGS
jgi:hypothetical protein